MNILAIYRHYWPDTTPYARLLRTILEHWAAEGHVASVYTAQPSYNDVRQPKQARRETMGGVRIRRIRMLPERKRFKLLRGVNFLWFLLRAVLHVLFRGKYDLIVANAHPPVLMGVALRFIKRCTGIPYLLHYQDVHPESAVLAGQLRDGPLAKWLLAADTRNCRAAAVVVTLSCDMRDTLAGRTGYAADNLHVINNFPLDRYVNPKSIPIVFQDRRQTSFRVLFAGNIGHFQGLHRLVAAAQLLEEQPQIRFIFMGEGAAREQIMALAARLIGRTVFFEPYQPVETAFACIQQSDIGIISLANGVYRVAYPSKTMTYLAAGLPVLVMVEPESDLASEVTAHRLGYVTSDNTVPSIVESIRLAFAEREKWTPQARNALIERSARLFARDRALSDWSQLARRLDVENCHSAAQDSSKPQDRAA